MDMPFLQQAAPGDVVGLRSLRTMGELNANQLRRVLHHAAVATIYEERPGITDGMLPRIVVAQQMAYDLTHSAVASGSDVNEAILDLLDPERTPLETGSIDTAHTGPVTVHVLRDRSLSTLNVMCALQEALERVEAPMGTPCHSGTSSTRSLGN